MRNTNANNFNGVNVNENGSSNNCRDCLYMDSCKNYLKQILSNPIHDVEEIKTEIINFDCNEFYSTDEADQDEIEELYNKHGYKEYQKDYDTYLNKFYNEN